MAPATYPDELLDNILDAAEKALEGGKEEGDAPPRQLLPAAPQVTVRWWAEGRTDDDDGPDEGMCWWGEEGQRETERERERERERESYSCCFRYWYYCSASLAACTGLVESGKIRGGVHHTYHETSIGFLIAMDNNLIFGIGRKEAGEI